PLSLHAALPISRGGGTGARDGGRRKGTGPARPAGTGESGPRGGRDRREDRPGNARDGRLIDGRVVVAENGRRRRPYPAGAFHKGLAQLEERLKIFEPSQTSGSYFRSTTRSFSGISALSVILMPSGQTSVQHLVMLQ